MYKVLVLDDEINILNALKRSLSRKVFSIRGESTNLTFHFYTNVHEVLEKIKNHSYDLFISDYKMPIMDGAEFLKRAYQIQPNAVRLILSGQTDKTGLIKAINEAKIYKFIEKPWLEDNLILSIQEAIEHKLEEELKGNSSEKEKQLLLDRLEEEEPGITQVNLSPEGYIILDDVLDNNDLLK